MTPQLEMRPSDFAQSLYLIDGQPFRLAGRPYLIPIYDGEIHQGILKTGRQVEKSTTLAVKMANTTLLKAFTRALFVAPQIEQVKTFSRSRLSKLFRYSQDNIVRRQFLDSHLSDQVFMKELKNGSEIYLRHAFDEADNIRGLSAHALYIDEVQDIFVDAIPVIRETQSHTAPQARELWFSGTPKTFSNTIEYYWGLSSQGEWVVQCPHCRAYQVLGIANMEPARYACRRCQGTLDTPVIQNGFWKETNPSSELKGFRISQLMVPWIAPAEVWSKYQTYSPAKFHNEVLGLSYETADKPFSEILLDEITQPEAEMFGSAQGEFANRPTFLGVDWGTGDVSFTAVGVFAWNSRNHFQLLHAHRFEHGIELEVNEQLRYISHLMQAFRVQMGVADWGFGFTQNQTLQHQFGRRLVPCYYSHNQKRAIHWDAGHERFIVRRTESLQRYVHLVQNHQVEWPGKNRGELKWLYENHLAEQAEYRRGANGRSEELVYTHPVRYPDDGFHMAHYAYLAEQIWRQSGSQGFSFAGTYSR